MSPITEEQLAELRLSAGARREAALKKAKNEIEAEYSADMQAIERLQVLGIERLRMLETVKTSANSKAVVAERPDGQKRDKTGPIEATREAIAILKDGFTARDVIKTINQRHPNAKIAEGSIFAAINKLKTAKNIEIATSGKGRDHPATYRMVNGQIRQDTSSA